MATAPTTTHSPVYLPREDYPGQVGQVGCSCGHRPRKPAQSARTMHSSYAAHAKRHDGAETDLSKTRYLSGPFAGMTWDERYAVESRTA